MATSNSINTGSSSGSGSSQGPQANWDANLQQGWQFYQQQMKMDKEQQALTFASNVEAKGQQMLMACIQNIR